jgi:hypothetical protein
MDHSLSTPLIALGRIVATPGARETLKKRNQLPQHFLGRHVREIGVRSVSTMLKRPCTVLPVD